MENTKKGITPIILTFFGVIILFFYKVQDILPPFIGAFILSYILAKPTALIEKKINNRALAATLVLIPLVGLIVLLIGMIIPAMQKQLIHLGLQSPLYIERLQTLLISALESLGKTFPGVKITPYETIISHLNNFENILYPLQNISLEIFAQGFELIHRMTMILLMPVITFYWLKEWPRFVQAVNLLVPPRHTTTWIGLGLEINKALLNFIAAQGTACLILAILYGIGLSIIGLNHALLLAVGIGFAAFIPFVGVMAGLIVCIFVALFQYDTWVSIFNVFIVFGTIQFIDASLLSPRIVGDRIGVNPAWIIFALLAGGNLFGFWGIMLAAPTTAIVSVITRFAAQKYRHADWYLEH